MNLDWRDFWRFFLHEKDTYENLEEINRMVYFTSLRKMLVADRMVIVLFLFLIVRSFLNPLEYEGHEMMFRALYLVIIVISAICDFFLSYVKKDYEHRYVMLKWFNPLLYSMTISWAVIFIINNMIAFGGAMVSIYRTAALVIPLCVYMHPLVYVIISVISDVTMMVCAVRLVSPVMRTVAMGSKGYDRGGIITLIVRVTLGVAFMYLEFVVRERIITLESQKKEISDLSTAQNRFFSSMSHEIRTPINTIIGLNEMIMREKVSDEVAEDAANIRAASNMLLHIINDILDMSKISSGQMKLTPVAYHPGNMLSDIVGMLWMRAKEKGLKFEVEIAPDIPSELYGDEVRIKQILINLLNNAIKYTKKGSVTLSIQNNGITDGVADIVYSVADTGMGIRKESLPYLFTAFKRVDEEQNRYIEGTGLGLSIVKELTELMGGTVTVNSVYTQGSTFVIEIPQSVTDFATIGNLEIEKKHEKNPSGNYRSSFEAPEAKVLVVDDNESNLLVVSKLLRDTLVNIDTATGGARALELTQENEYDVILMDHLMPEMNGIECFHRIKDQVGGASKNARVVALTANAGSEMRKLYSDEGFDGYLVKPVSPSDLESELERLLPKDLVTVVNRDENIVESSMSWLDNRKRKKPIAITSESVADIPASLLEKYGIDLIPHKVETQEGVFADGREIDSDGLLEYMADDHNVRTHAPSVKEHEEFFAKSLSRANNILHITISSRVAHSGFDEAKDGARAFDSVTIFDSRHLSSGQGLLAIEACKLASSGMSVGEIIKRLEYARKYVHTNFIVENLDYLARSKQVSFRIAAICKAIMVHPVIEMKNGKMTVGQIFFGSRSHSWTKYIASCLSNVSDIDKSTLFITYVGLNKKDLDLIKAIVEKRVKFDNVYCQKASPAIAVNSGPGTFGLLFLKKM